MKRALEQRLFDRYQSLCHKHGSNAESFMDFSMTLFFSDEQYPLDFERLLKFPDFDFMHDVCGMIRHMNRETTKLENCFVPRCAKPEVPA